MYLTMFVLLLLFLTVFVVLYLTRTKHDSNGFVSKTRCYVINLHKNPERIARFRKRYESSDIRAMRCHRFEAIDGNELTDEEFQEHVHPRALRQMYETEASKVRKKHYQITKGAVGCYLSHLSLYRKLLKDPHADQYLIFEDDAMFKTNLLELISHKMDEVPNDWDMVVFGAIRESGNMAGFDTIKINTFWGLCCYVINKKGAEKITREFERKKIDMQIDSVMTVMAIEERINIYGVVNKPAWHAKMSTTIQTPILHEDGIDPYDFEQV